MRNRIFVLLFVAGVPVQAADSPGLHACVKYAEADAGYEAEAAVQEAKAARDAAKQKADDAYEAARDAAQQRAYDAYDAARDVSEALGAAGDSYVFGGVMDEPKAARDAAQQRADADYEAAVREPQRIRADAYLAIYEADTAGGGIRSDVPEIMAKLRVRHRFLCRVLHNL